MIPEMKLPSNLNSDVFHVNTVTVLQKDVKKDGKKLFKKGDVMTCIRNLSVIGVIDMKEEKITWFTGHDFLEFPHFPSVVDDNNILIFDNGMLRGWSRAIEIDPITDEIKWEFKADPPEAFFTKDRGAAQRLPNGNTLLTESIKGRVIEVTREGKIAWEFFNPEKTGPGKALPENIEAEEKNKGQAHRAAIYRFLRITDTKPYKKFLKN